MVSFDSLATPRQGHAGPCCERVESRLLEMDDQRIALCLDGVRTKGFLWIDPRNAELWAVRRVDDDTGLRFVGTRGEWQAPAAPAGEPRELGDRTLMHLLDRAVPGTAD